MSGGDGAKGGRKEKMEEERGRRRRRSGRRNYRWREGKGGAETRGEAWPDNWTKFTPA